MADALAFFFFPLLALFLAAPFPAVLLAPLPAPLPANPRLAFMAAALLARPVAIERSAIAVFLFFASILPFFFAATLLPEEALACSLRRSEIISSVVVQDK
ncbi:unnamed protein product [Pseudo-nitzschia multistriata]|uniref:Uncharacterized protein n=1 Tax=Pseudo-nitzschia multistriata TaxID=183589 RepID=A0A448ZRU5_9STRA|nr:unnamed protein product [Pseudo-nitzschia multistriata]